MRYALITPDGQCELKTGDWQAEFGGDYSARIRLSRDVPMTGWVGDHSLLNGQPRNIHAAALVGTLGAGAVHPVAGPLVVTGFDWSPPDPCDLDEEHAALVVQLADDIRLVLCDDPAAAELGEWADAVRQVASHVRDAEVPPTVIRSGEKTITVPAGDTAAVLAAMDEIRGAGQ